MSVETEELRSFVVTIHPCGDPVRTLPALQLMERERADALILFGDVTGPVLSDADRILYGQARALFQDAGSIHEKVRIAQAILARPGLAASFRDALRFYLSQIADLAADDQVVWKDAYARAVSRLREFAVGLAPYRHAVVADTLVCEDAFEGKVLDFHSLSVGGKTLKGLGLSPRELVLVPVKYVPEEFRQDLGCAVPLAEYLERFDVLVANAFPPALQEQLRGAREGIVVLPGARPEVSSFENLTLVFESPQTLSLYTFYDARLVRKVYRPAGSQLRLVRIDAFDERMRLVQTEDNLDRLPLVPAVAREEAAGEGTPPPADAASHAGWPVLLLIWPRRDAFVDVMALRYGESPDRFRVVSDGLEAQAYLDAFKPDVVIVREPGSPEAEFVARLNAERPENPVPVIPVYPAGTDARLAGERGLVEPFDVREAFARIESVVRVSSRQAIS